MSKKFTVLSVAILGTAVLAVTRYSVQWGLCREMDYSCVTSFDKVEIVSYFFPILLFFSLVTYCMPQRVFAAWWRYAKYAILVSLIALVGVVVGVLHGGTAGSGGLGGFVNGAIDRLALTLIHGLFSLGSLIQIARGYFRK